MPIIPISGSAATRGSMVPLGSATTTADGQTIAFTNIPQGYRDLYIVGSARLMVATQTLSNDNWTVNNDASGTLWSNLIMYGVGAGVVSAAISGNNPYAYVYTAPSINAAPNAFAALEGWIMNYASTSTFKHVISRSSSDLNGSGQVALNYALYRSNTAVTSVQLSGNFFYAAGTSFQIYGIRTVNQ